MDLSEFYPSDATIRGCFLIFIGIIIFHVLAILTVIVLVFLNKKRRKSFKSQHVLITGGSSGIGLAAAIDAGIRGAKVTIVARNESRLKQAVSEIRSQIGESNGDGEDSKIRAISVDISSSVENIEKAFKIAENQNGPIDVLINCAGYSVAEKMEDLSNSDVQGMMNCNWMGSVLPTTAVIRQMKSRRSGHIVFVSSMAGQVGLYGFTGYAASKYAVRGLAEALHMELKPYNIDVTIVFPPDTDTPGFEKENLTKPKETQLISDAGGCFSARQVAKIMLDDIEKGEFLCNIGIDGWMLGNLTAGMSPVPKSLSNALTQVLFSGWFRLVAMVYRNSWDSIIKTSLKSRMSEKKVKFNENVKKSN